MDIVGIIVQELNQSSDHPWILQAEIGDLSDVSVPLYLSSAINFQEVKSE